MPNYQFKCLDCGHTFEALLPAGTRSAQCLECGHPESQKLLAAPGVVFKGSGFYKTDSRKSEDKVRKSPVKKEVKKDNKKNDKKNSK